MLKLKSLKMNQKGFSYHFILPLIVVALVSLVGYKLLFASHADSISVSSNTFISGVVGDGTSNGYWLYGSDGAVYAEGNAPYYGSMGGKKLTGQIINMAATYDHKGYYMVGSDGAVYAFGDAQYVRGMNASSTYSAIPFPGAIIGIVAHNGGGYWIITSTGATYAFGGAPFLGDANNSSGITSVTSSPDGKGLIAVSSTNQIYNLDTDTNCSNVSYTFRHTIAITTDTSSQKGTPACVFMAADGIVYGTNPDSFGYYGSISNSTPQASPAVGIAPTGDGKGYWIVEANGSVFSYGDAVYSYTTPVKFTRPGAWTNIGTGNMPSSASGSQNISYTGYACRILVGNNFFVQAQFVPASSVASLAFNNVIQPSVNENTHDYSGKMLSSGISSLNPTLTTFDSPFEMMFWDSNVTGSLEGKYGSIGTYYKAGYPGVQVTNLGPCQQ